MTDKLFTVCGVSTLDGETKVRFANDVLRVKVLDKHGHKDITLIELPNAMTKLEAAKFIADKDEFQGVAAKAAIADYLDRKDEKPKAKKEEAKPVAKKTTTKKAKEAAPAATEEGPAAEEQAGELVTEGAEGDDDKPF